MLIKNKGCFEKDLLYLTFLVILKVNGANWFLVLEKIRIGKNNSIIAMLGLVLAMPSGQGLNMIFLVILKINRAN